MTQISSQQFASNVTLEQLMAATWVSLQLPVTVSLPSVIHVGGVVYKPSWRQRIVAVRSDHAQGLIASGWKVLEHGDGVGDPPPGLSTCPFLQNFLANGWKLLPEGGLDGSNA
jgi:hypothetical protein